jgi:hypothetical protein
MGEVWGLHGGHEPKLAFNAAVGHAFRELRAGAEREDWLGRNLRRHLLLQLARAGQHPREPVAQPAQHGAAGVVHVAQGAGKLDDARRFGQPLRLIRSKAPPDSGGGRDAGAGKGGGEGGGEAPGVVEGHVGALRAWDASGLQMEWLGLEEKR